MKVPVTVVVLLTFFCLLAVSVAEAGELDDFVRSLNVRAQADSDGFKADLAARFRVPGTQVEVMLKTVDNPADAYMCLRIAQIAHLSTKAVLKEYQANKGKGWGVIAKNLGIKPGSRDFHELKREYFYSDIKRPGKRKGKGANNTSVRDLFTDTNGTVLDSHKPDVNAVGSGWASMNGGGGDIQSNQLRLTTNAAGHVIETSEFDIIIEIDWTPANGVDNRNSIVFRYQDDNNYWNLNLREPNGDINIWKTENGNSAIQDSAAFSWSEGTTYRITLVAHGDSIEGYIDGVLYVSCTDATFQTKTKHGLKRDNGDNATRLDDFAIYAFGDGNQEQGLSLERRADLSFKGSRQRGQH